MLQNDLDRATRNTRTAASFKKVIGNIGSSKAGSKFNSKTGVLVRGAFRKHRGSGSKTQAAGKMQAHIKYLAGDKHKDAKEKRELYNERGQAVESEVAQEAHKDAFIEHRIVISPAGDNTSKKDLHVLSQAMIQEVKERNPKAEVAASYAIHKDTAHPHAHVLITSPNVVKLDKEFYAEMRQEMKELKDILEQERSHGREHSHTLKTAFQDDIKQEFQQEMEQSR